MNSYASAEELQQRIGSLQEAMQQKSLAGALIIQRADLFYFSGTGQNGHLYIPESGEPTLLVKKSLSRAKAESALKKIIAYSGTEQLKELVTSQIPENSAIGIELQMFYRQPSISAIKKPFRKYQLVDLSGVIRLIRSSNQSMRLT
jgi:Xaa-Pro dipeptidase